jgi:DNA-binding HxlR family transcriptional regulator
MEEQQRIPSDLDATEREFLIMLWSESLLEKVIAKRLTTEKLEGPPLTRRLRGLAKRGLVAHIPAPHGSLWCLTRAGREMAQALQQQDRIISEEAR